MLVFVGFCPRLLDNVTFSHVRQKGIDIGNAIKNYERKKRREQKEAQREIRKAMHDAIVKKCGFPPEVRKIEGKIFDCLN